jgi:hypothetical protein
MVIGHMGGADKVRMERKSTRRKTCRCGNLSTTNSTCNNVISNPALRSERQTTNRMRHYIILCVLAVDQRGCFRTGTLVTRFCRHGKRFMC